jgi:hypothetical protein
VKTARVSTSFPSIAFEWSDPSTYTAIGGGHGYVIVFRRPSAESNGFAIERTPQTFEPESRDEPQYATLADFYDLFSGDICYLVMLDACNDVFDESTAELQWFLDNLVVE